jgi:hypothetical protein
MDYKELMSLRSQTDMHMPVKVELNKKANSPTEAGDWQTEYWNSIMGLLYMGGYLFVWGLVFAIVLAGGFMIVGAVLMWAAAFLMMVTYPIWVFFSWMGSLFSRSS